MEATPGWVQAGLPGAGDALYGEDGALEALWRSIPAPGPGHEPAGPVALSLGGRAFTAILLGGASLGVVLVVPKEG